MTATAPGGNARPASSTFGLSDSPGSSSSLFLSLSGEASPYSSSVSCGNYSLNNSNLAESPNFKHQVTLIQQQQQQLQHQQCQQFGATVEDWQTHFLQLQQHSSQQPDSSHSQILSQQQQTLQHGNQSDSAIWGCLDHLTQPDDPDSSDSQRRQQAAFEAYNELAGCGFSVRPQMLAECRGDTLHNRIFERGENYFGFSAEDRLLLESAIKPDVDHQLEPVDASPNPLLTHFPRRKMDADLRVPATVYLDDKSGRRQLTLDVSCDVPVSKLLVRCQAISLMPGDYPSPCSKCSDKFGRLLVSIASHSLEGLVHADAERQQSCLYATGQPEAGQMWLTLRYNCCQDHLRNSQRLGHLALANLITVIEAFDQLGCLIGRASYRVRVVASPARDLLRFLTNQLTPAQTVCTLGQCAHLAARWKPERFRQLPSGDLSWCLDQFRFKDDLRVELQALLTAAGSRRIDSAAVVVKRKNQDEVQREPPPPLQTSPSEALQILPDGSLLVRSANSAKLARIRSAVAAILAETDQQTEVTTQPTVNLQPPVQQVQQAASASSASTAMAFQPILLIRPYCQFQ